MNRTNCFIVALLFASATFGQMPLHKVPNIAHRGFSDKYPENTLSAIRETIKVGADGCEFDVYSTSDGVVVLCHDKTWKRTAGLDQKVADTPYSTVKTLDVGSWKSPQFEGEKVPTLDEALALFIGAKTCPVIEIKVDDIENKVIESLRKANLIDKAVIISFQESVVKKIRAFEPKICVAFLYTEDLKGKSADECADDLAKTLVDFSEKLGTPVLDIYHKLISPKLISLLADKGITVWCWTVNDEIMMKQLLDLGVKSVTTDRPDVLNKVLAQ